MIQKHTLDSKDILAKVLSTENLRIVHSKTAATASFNMETRTLTLPKFVASIKSETINMFVGHEVGHALFSPSKDAGKKLEEAIDYVSSGEKKNYQIAKGYLNIVEDARIERLFKKRYPGLVPDFKIGYSELLDRDFFRLRGKDTNKFPFIDRINILFKGMGLPIAESLSFSAPETAFLTKIQGTKTWEDVVSLTKEIYDFCKHENPDSQSSDMEMESGPQNSKDVFDNEETEEIGDGDGESSEEEGSGAGESETGNSDKTGKKESDCAGAGESIPKKSTRGGMGPNANGAPAASITDGAFKENLQSIVDKTGVNNYYINIPKLKIEKYIKPYTSFLRDYVSIWKKNSGAYNNVKDEFAKFQKENLEVINYLFSEFNKKKKAEEYQKEKADKTGTIDCSKLAHYKYSEDIFKSNIVKYIGKNHNLAMFVDFSGSMCDNIHETVQQAICLALFAQKAGITFSLYTFGSKCTAASQFNQKDYNNDDLIIPNGFVLREIFSPKMSRREFYAACINLLAATGRYGHNLIAPDDMLGGWTPLSEAILSAVFILEKNKKDYKTTNNHVIVLTDGDGAPLTSYIGNNNVETSYSGKYNFIIHDPVSKRDYDINKYNISSKMDRLFGELLRHRTGCNLIGFFCTGGGKRETINQARSWVSKSPKELAIEYDKYNFITCTEKGYNEYYIIPGKKELSVSNNNTIQASNADYLITLAENRKKKRILLNRFIHLITEQPQKV